MPRSRPAPPICEEQAREIRRLKDELYLARQTIIDLMPENLREILDSYYQIKTTQDWYRWPDQTAEKITALCTHVTDFKMGGYVLESRAKCPLCGDGPQSYYDGQAGFKLPEGLRRHLTGYGRSRECPVFGAARALGRDHYQTMKREGGPNWSATKSPKGS